MSSQHSAPTEISLNRKTRILHIEFDDGLRCSLPCEYVRIFSPAADAKVARSEGNWITGKQNVNIERISPVGNYAVQIIFDDGHDTGIYSWDTLYELGQNYEKNWAHYLRQIQKPESKGLKRVLILYFSKLVVDLGLESEEVSLNEDVANIAQLLVWLRTRGEKWSSRLADDQVTVTVNKQFADLSTPMNSGDEISITPKFQAGRA